MLQFFKKIMKEENGNILVLAALTLVFLMGMAGLAIDGGLVYMTKSQLQKTANAAVLSGAQELTNTNQKVTTVVNDILTAHKESASLTNLEINMGNNVKITLMKHVKLTFASLFGFNNMDVTAHAAAGLQAIGSSIGAAPLGIDQSITLEYYKSYQLKVTSSDVTSGNFGILALGGTGAATYSDNLTYGYQNELKIGDIINTQTGNIAGDTRNAINLRVNGCTQPPGDYSLRNCSRILLVPVYKPYSISSKQLKSVQITGFAYFYITNPMSSTDTSITGVFIKRTGNGSYVEGSVDRGAYSIRLTE
jgi:Putative Flp pilus-assembly TadE/G-like